MKLAGVALLSGGIVAELAAIIAALRQIMTSQVNPYVASFCMGIGLGITIMAAVWTQRRDRHAEEARENQRREDAKREREVKERLDNERHEQNREEMRKSREESRELRKLIEGGGGYHGLLAAAERSEWRRHQLVNVLTPMLNDLREMAEAICELADKADVRFRREIADTFARAAERLQEQPPFVHHRSEDRRSEDR